MISSKEGKALEKMILDFRTAAEEVITDRIFSKEEYGIILELMPHLRLNVSEQIALLILLEQFDQAEEIVKNNLVHVKGLSEIDRKTLGIQRLFLTAVNGKKVSEALMFSQHQGDYWGYQFCTIELMKQIYENLKPSAQTLIIDQMSEVWSGFLK